MGPTAQADRSGGSDRRRRWLVAGMVVAVGVAGAGTAVLTRSATSDQVTTGDADVVIPDREQLQDPDGRSPVEEPQVTCEREGEPVDCVAWVRRLVSASSAPALHSWWVEVAPDRVLAHDAETIVALSRTTGQLVWRRDVDAGEGPAGGPLMVGGEVMAIQTGQTVRALSLVDGAERWSVDDAFVAVAAGSDEPLGRIYTVRVRDARSVLVAHEADGTVRWRHTVAEVDPQGPPRRAQVTEDGSVAFVVVHGPDQVLRTIALDRDDGAERWRRVDSRPLQAWGDVAVVLDVDRVVDEEGNQISVSESPAAVVGLDVAEGTERWRREAAGAQWEFGIVDDRLVTIEDDGLTGVDPATGEDLWHRDGVEGERLIDAAFMRRPSVSQHQRVFSYVPRDRLVLARDPATGEILWQTQLDQPVGHVSTVDGAILARVNESTVVHLDPATGHVRGTITAESDGRPRLLAGDVFVDPETGWVAGIDLSEG